MTTDKFVSSECGHRLPFAAIDTRSEVCEDNRQNSERAASRLAREGFHGKAQISGFIACGIGAGCDYAGHLRRRGARTDARQGAGVLPAQAVSPEQRTAEKTLRCFFP